MSMEEGWWTTGFLSDSDAALSAASRTSPEADLERLTLWCLGRFQGKVSPGHGALLLSPRPSSSGIRLGAVSLRLSLRVAIS
uniref:Uncharacterized protein n=1 Tax=Knipowitschia caucasica TaxID=637954 RepID=A0AAV2MBE1_KNICA